VGCHWRRWSASLISSGVEQQIASVSSVAQAVLCRSLVQILYQTVFLFARRFFPSRSTLDRCIGASAGHLAGPRVLLSHFSPISLHFARVGSSLSGRWWRGSLAVPGGVMVRLPATAMIFLLRARPPAGTKLAFAETSARSVLQARRSWTRSSPCHLSVASSPDKRDGRCGNHGRAKETCPLIAGTKAS
jgi:hypothetical protein